MARDNEFSYKKYFPFYRSWTDSVLALTDEEAGILIKMICRYDKESVIPEPITERMDIRYFPTILFSGWRGNLDSAKAHFDEVSYNRSHKEQPDQNKPDPNCSQMFPIVPNCTEGNGNESEIKEFDGKGWDGKGSPKGNRLLNVEEAHSIIVKGFINAPKEQSRFIAYNADKSFTEDGWREKIALWIKHNHDFKPDNLKPFGL